MEIFGIGAGELLIILIVALLIWGPNRIVEIGRTLGKISRYIKNASTDFTTQLTKELEQEEKKPNSDQRK